MNDVVKFDQNNEDPDDEHEEIFMERKSRSMDPEKDDEVIYEKVLEVQTTEQTSSQIIKDDSQSSLKNFLKSRPQIQKQSIVTNNEQINQIVEEGKEEDDIAGNPVAMQPTNNLNENMLGSSLA